MPLTDTAIKKVKPEAKQFKMTDGGGMFLLIHPNGGKYWQMDYRFEGKRKTLALGVYPDVCLADAREGRDEARKLLKKKVDPGAIKQAAKLEKKNIVQVVVNSFKILAVEYHTLKIPMWTPGHAKQWLINMEKYAFPLVGDRPITEIEPMELVGIMRTVEANGTFETRDRLLQTIGAVFKYAIATGRAKYNPAEIRKALADRPKEEHFACIITEEIPAFLRAFDEYVGRGKVSLIAVSAFKLLLLTAVRTSEVRFSKWADFDLDKALWVIPEEQTGRKGKVGKRKPHTVPLSSQAVAVLRELYPITGHGEYAFPNRNDTTRVISENTITKIIETMGYKGRQTGHGFRGLARTTLGELGCRREVLEAMLSHAIENETEAAYVRTSYLNERREIMQKWADYLDVAKAGAQVIPFSRTA